MLKIATLVIALSIPSLAIAQSIHDVGTSNEPSAEAPADLATWQSMHLVGTNHHFDNMIYFSPNGTLRVQLTSSKRGANGTWTMEPGKICLNLPTRGSECFAYTQMLQKGQTVSVSSDRGWTANVTMLTDPTGTAFGQPPMVAAL